ncbi:SRR1-like protein [Tubulanus polymorphus]|uniref:SRR1-like protein n=1 Tax=Tubulanus polymorphus TaxID=672921 RepID=UPI003DA51E8D
MLESEFKVVKHKKNKRDQRCTTISDLKSDPLTAGVVSYSDIEHRFRAIRNEPSVIDIAESIAGELRCWRPGECHKLKIVCYGLGQFVTCITARYQLMVLYLITEKLQIPKSNCVCFDPMFTSNELNILKEIEFSIEDKNEEGKHLVSGPTVFYMPHCGKALYNNLLWANWSREKLQEISIIGNSFSEMKSRLLDKVMETQYKYINNILPRLCEHPISVSADIESMFCNTSIQTFSVSSEDINEQFWNNCDIPVYEDDVEIIRCKDTSRQ